MVNAAYSKGVGCVDGQAANQRQCYNLGGLGGPGLSPFPEPDPWSYSKILYFL